MRTIALLGVVAAAAFASSAAGSRTSAAPLLATVGQGSATRLALVDPVTLQPAGRSTQIGRYGWPWARSPDGTRLALGGDPARVRIVDLRKMGTVAAFQLRGSSVEGIAWVKPRLILAAVGQFAVVAADPVSRRILWRRYLPNPIETIERSADGFVMLVRAGEYPPAGLGPTALLAIGADGKLRSVTLDSLRSGDPDFTETPPVNQIRRPGLAVDPVGRRAFVVGAGEPVAEVDLQSL